MNFQQKLKATAQPKVMRGTYQKQPAFALEIQNSLEAYSKNNWEKEDDDDVSITLQISRVECGNPRIVKCVACRLPVFYDSL